VTAPYQNLVRGLYALDGLDGAFLGALAAPIVTDGVDGTLATIPAIVAANLLGRIEEIGDEIAAVRAEWEDEHYGDMEEEDMVSGLFVDMLQALEAERSALVRSLDLA
jgi:hypothetical protein